MTSGRLKAPRLIACATLLSVSASAATAGAPAQQGPLTQLAGVCSTYRGHDSPPLSDNGMPHDATEGDLRDPANCPVPTASAGQPARFLAGPRGRPFLTVLVAVPLVTYVGAVGPRGSEILTPSDRFATSQLVGVGYVLNPRFRFGVMGIFNEVLTGLPPAVDAWQFGGVAPVAIGTFGHLIIGGGPIIGYRSGGKHQSDVGAVVLVGASIPLRKGLALNIAAPTTAMFVRRVTVSAGVAVGVAKVF
jgi:hypothetical protein